jgi:hypothetical protein
MSLFDNEDMAEVYGRLSEAIDMGVVVRKKGSRIAVFDGYYTKITIEAEGYSLCAEGRTRYEKFEIGADAAKMARIIKRIISIEPYNEEDRPFMTELSISEVNQDE